MKKILKNSLLRVIGIVIVIIILCFFVFKGVYNPVFDNKWDVVSAFAAWAGVFTSFIAIWFAIQVPKKIAENQNKIALFEKRYECFQFFEKCYVFGKNLKNNKDINNMRQDCLFLFDINFESFDLETLSKKLDHFEYMLHQMEFLFLG